MADHYLRSIELLDEIADLRDELRVEYARPTHRRERVADLQQDINRCLKLADIHAQLSVRQELVGIAGQIDHRGVEVSL